MEEPARFQRREQARFMQAALKNPNAVRLPSGVVLEVLEKGAPDARSPREGDECAVHYHGTLGDGTVFDSTIDRGAPVYMAPNQGIEGWEEALQLMREGDKWNIYVPYEKAYGWKGSPPTIPVFAPLKFYIELISVNREGKTADEASEMLQDLINKPYSELSITPPKE